MEYLRWILLLAGILFILVVYIMGRQHRRHSNWSDNIELDSDLPDISARDWDDVDEGVGDVRIVAQYDDEDDAVEKYDAPHFEPEVESSNSGDDTTTAKPVIDKKLKLDDLVTLYLLAKDEPLSGDMINSAAYANGLSFGKMNIFHRLDDNNEPLYSLANMMEPGDFDPETIHTLKTRGLVLFIQLAQLKNSSEALHDMLRCAYRMAEMIGARLCNNKRQPLTEKDTNAYRQLAAHFDDES